MARSRSLRELAERTQAFLVFSVPSVLRVAVAESSVSSAAKPGSEPGGLARQVSICRTLHPLRGAECDPNVTSLLNP